MRFPVFGRFPKTKLLILVAGAALVSSAPAIASPMLYLDILGSTTGAANSYTSTLPATIRAGASVYFEVVALSAPAGTTSTNPEVGGKSPDGMNDYFNALPTFTLSIADTSGTSDFLNITGPPASPALNSSVSGGTGASPGTVSGSMLQSVRAIAGPGSFVADDASTTSGIGAPLVTGEFTFGSKFTAITGSTDAGSNTGSIYLAGDARGNLVGVSNDAAASDPIIAYNSLTVATPEPASLTLLGLGSAVLFTGRRRRR